MGLGRSLKIAIPILVASLVAAGCGTTPEDAEERLCTDLAALKADLGSLGTAASTSASEEGSASDLDAARRQAKRSWQDVVNDLQDVKGARADDLEDSWDDLSSALDDVDDGATVAEAREEVGPELAEFTTAREEMFSRLNCGE